MAPLLLKFDGLKYWGCRSEFDLVLALEELGVQGEDREERNSVSGKGAGCCWVWKLRGSWYGFDPGAGDPAGER